MNVKEVKKTAAKLAKHEADKCLSCGELLEDAGFLRLGTPCTYQPVLFCDNVECNRYGLVSIYKLLPETV